MHSKPCLASALQNDRRSAGAMVRTSVLIESRRGPGGDSPRKALRTARDDVVKINLEVLDVRPDAFPLVGLQSIQAGNNVGLGAKRSYVIGENRPRGFVISGVAVSAQHAEPFVDGFGRVSGCDDWVSGWHLGCLDDLALGIRSVPHDMMPGALYVTDSHNSFLRCQGGLHGVKRPVLRQYGD